MFKSVNFLIPIEALYFCSLEEVIELFEQFCKLSLFCICIKKFLEILDSRRLKKFNNILVDGVHRSDILFEFIGKKAVYRLSII